ncbi:DMT family transporter [Bacteroidia bacterium]|nr:DMT family transporter [Bacteroidia bacterium]MDC1430733.1 DMT family transporter [Bacteroidia bacterium]
MKLDKKIRVHLAMFSVALFYAANYSIAKWAMPEFISPFAFITLRVGCGALFFGAYYFLFSREKIIDTRDYLDFAVCAFFGVALNMLAFFKGLSMTSAINASVLMLLSPIMVVLYTAIGTKSRIKSQVILGILISFIGAALLVNAGSFSLSSDGLHGDLLILLNACSFAFHLYYVARLLKKYKASTVTAFMFMIGFMFVLPFGFSEFLAVQWHLFTAQAIFALVFVVLFVTLLNYILNVWAVQHSSSSQVGSYIYLQPLLATTIAIGLGMDVLTWGKATFGLLILLGLWLVNRGR